MDLITLPAGPLAKTDLRPVTASLGSLLYQHQADELDLDIPCQRGSVWGQDRQRMLIASLLRGVPIGAIYYNVLPSDPARRYRVVDGRQRIAALVAFMTGALTVPADWFPAEDRTGVTEPAVPDGPPHLRFTTGLTEAHQRDLRLSGSLSVLHASLPDEAAEQELFDLINHGGVPQGQSDAEPAGPLVR